MSEQFEGYDLPTSSADFITFMKRVYEHAPGDALYDKFHDALSTALLCGMKKKIGSCLGGDGENYLIMGFRGEIDGVVITLRGCAARSEYHFGKRTY
jgi:hypothetical protein